MENQDEKSGTPDTIQSLRTEYLANDRALDQLRAIQRDILRRYLELPAPCHCVRCGHIWHPKLGRKRFEDPYSCPSCHSVGWREPAVNTKSASLEKPLQRLARKKKSVDKPSEPVTLPSTLTTTGPADSLPPVAKAPNSVATTAGSEKPSFLSPPPRPGLVPDQKTRFGEDS